MEINALETGKKPSALRRVVVMIPHYGKDDKVGRAKGSSILERREETMRLFADALSSLEKEVGFAFPPISVDIQRRPVSGVPLAEVVEKWGDRMIRGVADFAATDLHSSGPALEDLGISHLISVKTDSETEGWASTAGISDTIVCTKVNSVHLLIVDLLLDISTFYSWHYLVANFGDSLAKRREISRRKAAFAVRRGLQSYYGPIIDSDISYFSFAAAVREGRSFGRSETRRFEEIWREFIGEEILGAEPSISDRFMPKSNVIDHIMKTHVAAGEISRRKLEGAVEPLRTGSYVIVRVKKWPRRERVVTQIRSLFGGTKKRGQFKIVQSSLIGEYLRHSRYLDFYSFQIENGGTNGNG